MNVILLGNAGSGKSTFSRKLLAREPAACLSLDTVAFADGPTRRPLADSIADVRRFIATHESSCFSTPASRSVSRIVAHARGNRRNFPLQKRKTRT
ncbi:AAA family ATPase [Rhabdochromatium marinum]|uniref:AAA family ATPase n=1 Tax=Rhabdochromatium marinum TaxID=48729 RepID=UPI003B82F6C9